jgi:hypothetical protein
MTLNETLQKAKDTKQTIEQLLSGIKTGTMTKDLIVASYLALAKQHHSSIILLIENNLYSSAVALSRPLLEACYRGTWVELIADEDECENINTPEYDWNKRKTWQLAKEVDNVLDDKVFHSVYERNIKALNGFTHGGLEQISRQINNKSHIMQPTFKDEELIELLNSSNGHLAMTLLAFAVNINNTDLANISKKLILEE